MKLSRVQVRNFRTLFDPTGQNRNAVDLLLSDGMNTLVGPNNCGKSNLVMAIALALDASLEFDYQAIVPAHLRGGKPRVTMTFSVEDRPGPQQTLLQRAHEYERSVHAGRGTYAEDGELRVAVSFLPGNRRQISFLVKGAGARTKATDSPEYQSLHTQFQKVVRFVMVRSGESLDSLLQGRFREILHMVIRDHLKNELDAAKVSRETYISALQAELLGPLRTRISDEVGSIFPEIRDAQLVPDIPMIDQTLSDIAVLLEDSARTDLHGKGTGVRGTVVAAMLGYLADQSRRSMIFAVEEPEAFLHPAAQEHLRDRMEELASRSDVTLLVTTHSPFIVSRKENSRIIELSKGAPGNTAIVDNTAGNEPSAERLGGLFRDPGIAGAIERALSTPAEARAVVVVEGYTDKAYLELAAQKSGRPDLIKDLHIVPAGGAKQMVLQAVLTASVSDRSVVVVHDDDPHGRAARDTLKSIHEKWSKRLVSVTQVAGMCKKHDVEAEDLWPPKLLEEVVSELGGDRVIDTTVKCGNSKHYGLDQVAKSQILGLLDSKAKATDCDQFLDLLRRIRELVDRQERSLEQSRRYAKQRNLS